ncbi:hypothetical protein Lal_00043412 [Lupinus albus]|nr:hypothetical protein Lal_00043412 [Lupinus albus]
MWDTLQVTHEGTSEVKRARLNALTHEYELFRMLPSESISDMQKRFTHIVNHLVGLDKSFARGELTNKVLRCLDRKWQPRVTAIVESKDLDSMPLATLFGKLQEHEMELGRLTMHEDSDWKKKNITLKATTSKSKEEKDNDESVSDLDDETTNLLVRKFSKFIKRKEKSTPREFKSKKAYIAWDVPEEETTSSTSSEEEKAKLCLMVRSDNDGKSDSHEDNNEVCLRTQGRKWYLDSGCSRHMTGDRSNFLDLSLKGKRYVTYGDNNKGKILGTGTIGNSFQTQIENVLYVEGLEHILLSPPSCISQTIALKVIMVSVVVTMDRIYFSTANAYVTRPIRIYGNNVMLKIDVQLFTCHRQVASHKLLIG